VLKRLNTTKIISIAFLATVLFGCGSTPPQVEPDQKQISLVNASLQPARYLTQAANADSNDARNRYVLPAAHAFINLNNANGAHKALRSIEHQLGQQAEIRAEHQYLSARTFELTANYDKALAILNYPSQWRLPNWQQVAYHQLKARLYHATKQPIEQVKQLSLLSALLPASQAQEVNNSIWRALQPMNEQSLLTFSKEPSNPILSGWLQLAYIAQHYAINPQLLVQHLGNWQHVNPTHPATIKLPTDLEKALNTKPYQPKNIAVLLPLTGPVAAVASTVKLGIMSYYLTNPDDKVAVNFFDTAKGAQHAYQEAVDGGAEFIIGPLLQSSVEQLQHISLQSKPARVPTSSSVSANSSNKNLTTLDNNLATQLPITRVPQLYLNHIDIFTPHDDQFYFALSPAHEASNAAMKMYADGITKPLILASNDAIGHRMAASFTAAWATLTPIPAETHYYDAGDKMKVAVQKSLGVIDSKKRIARIESLIGKNIKSDFRSRTDIDAIYLIAGNKDLSLLKPFVEVNFSVFSEPVPMYSTSRSRAADTSKEAARELNKLIISEIPWLLQSNSETQLVESLWPTWNYGQKRLYIMGYDSLELVGKLAQMRALPGYQFSGRSGILSVSPDGIVNLQLSWGRYQRGELRPQR